MSVRYRPRVVIADEHLLVAEACKRLLDEQFEVVALVREGRTLLQAVADLHPDVVISAVAMPFLNGLDACEQITRKHRKVKVVFLTMIDHADVAAEAFRRGASGYVLKHSPAHELIVAVRRVLGGDSYLSPMITKSSVEFLLRKQKQPHSGNPLTLRQREVLQLLAEGKTMKEIAYLLNVQAGTVAFHKYKIMETLDIKTNGELIQYAIQQHMVSSC